MDKILKEILQGVSGLYEGTVSAAKLQMDLQDLGGGNSFSGPFDGSKNLAYDGAMARTGYAGEFRAILLQAMKFFETEQMRKVDGIEGGGLVVAGDVARWREATGNDSIPEDVLAKCTVYYNGTGDDSVPFIYRAKNKIKGWKFLESTKQDGVYVASDTSPWDR